MTHTVRRISRRDRTDDNRLTPGPEQSCRPGCGLCGKDRHSKKARKHGRRMQDRAMVAEQVTR